jgi:hypothetical protein
MSLHTLIAAITKVCHDAADAGDGIETIVAALHIAHESAMFSFKMRFSLATSTDSDEALEETK